MIDITILESDIFDDMPPTFSGEETYRTPDQMNEFWVNKFYWSEVREALARHHQGLPLENPEWPKPFKEMMMADLDYYLALYHLVNVAWFEIKSEFNQKQLEKFKTPGDLFLTILWMDSVARVAPCLAKKYCYPVRRYFKQLKNLTAGKPFEYETTPILEASLWLVRFVLEVCAHSKNRVTQKALKDLRGTMLKLIGLHTKWLNPKQKLPGGQWVDGVFCPPRIGARYTSNPEGYR